MRVYFARHGQTLWNKRRKLQGQKDIMLTDRGREQARESAEGMKEIPFDCVYTSPLKRAVETAQILRGDRQIPLIRDERLKELSFGVIEGRNLDKILDNPEKKRLKRLFTESDKYRAPKHGESVLDLVDRTRSFYEECIIPLEGSYEHILVVAHGCTIRSFIMLLNDRPVSEFWKSSFGANCSTAIFECKNGVTTMLSENKIFYQERRGEQWNNRTMQIV